MKFAFKMMYFGRYAFRKALHEDYDPAAEVRFYEIVYSFIFLFMLTICAQIMGGA